MENKLLNSKDSNSIWNIEDNFARVHVDNFSAVVDIHNPSIGLHQLQINNKPAQGCLLGMKPLSEITSSSLADCYARGRDLVTRYTHNDQQKFSYEIYWRVISEQFGSTTLEAIISLQTDLLESFPEFLVKTELKSDEILVHGDLNSQPNLVLISESTREGSGLGLLLMRSLALGWSYTEMAHPDDPNEWQFQRNEDGLCEFQRRLGGVFMEKGVIRRMRIRGAISPLENDQEHANKFVEEFSSAAPPLTT